MIRRLYRYLFPPRRLQSKLPLLPRRYSSEHCPTGQLPAADARKAAYLKLHGVARTDADAYRLLAEHEGLSVQKIIKMEKRKRRFANRWRRAWRRFWRLW
jgi:hypothetical protein